eukprot:1370-Heterococcus_DN1.PRE.2
MRLTSTSVGLSTVSLYWGLLNQKGSLSCCTSTTLVRLRFSFMRACAASWSLLRGASAHVRSASCSLPSPLSVHAVLPEVLVREDSAGIEVRKPRSKVPVAHPERAVIGVPPPGGHCNGHRCSCCCRGRAVTPVPRPLTEPPGVSDPDQPEA